MIKTLTVVIADGSVPAGTIVPLEPFTQRIDIPRGEDSGIRLKIRKADGTRFDLTGWDIRFAVRRLLADASAMFTRVATLVQPVDLDDDPQWDAEVVLDFTDTLGLIEKKNYHFDVQLTDPDDNRWQGVPDSVFHILPIVGQVEEPILPPLVDEGAPIAIGPPGPPGSSVLNGIGPPDDALDGLDGDWYIDRTVPAALVIYGPKSAGVWGAGYPFGGSGGANVSTEDPLPGALTADPGSGPEASAWDHVHPYTIAVAGGAAGWMSGTMAQQLSDLVAADFGGQIADVAADLLTLATTVGGHTSTLASHTSSISTLTSGLAAAVAVNVTQTADIATNTSAIATLTSSVATNTSNIAANTSAIGTLQAIDLIAGAGLTGGGTLSGANRTFNVGQNADNSITVNANDIQLSTTLQTAISANTSNISSLTSTVAGLSSVYVPQARTITAGAGLTGTGDLSANRTLAVGANADGSITVNADDIQVGILATDAQHGNRGGGGLHADVVAGGASGFMSGTQASQLATNTTNIATNTTNITTNTSGINSLKAIKYLIQVADATVPNAQAMGALGTGLVKNTTTTGVQSIAVANTDFPHPSATYIVQASANAPSGAQVLGSLATGILKSTTSTGVLSIAAAADIPSLLTTKGDLLGFSTVPLRVAVGTDGWVVTADAASAPGWKWAAIAGGSGADALGTYVVKTATNAPANAQVLASLATGFAKVTTTTGVVSTQATILGTDLSGFTDTTLPVANSSGQLVSSAITLASNVLTHAASSSGGTVSAIVSNSSNTASSTAALTIKVAGATAGDASLTLSTTVTDWKWNVENATNDRLQLFKGAVKYLEIDPVSGNNQLYFSPANAGRIGLGTWAATGDSKTGLAVQSTALSASQYFNIVPESTAGKGFAILTFNGTKWTNILSFVNPAANQPTLKLVENGGQVQASGTNTVASAAGAIWDAFDHQASTLTLSGSTSVTTATGVNYVDIKQPTITSGSALTVSAAATVRIAAAPLAAGSTTITKAYSLWIDAGLPRIDSTTPNGAVLTSLTGVGPTGANTTVQEWLTIDINGTTRYLPCF